MRRTVSVIAAALAVGVTSVGVASAAPAPTKDFCKSGGYAKYVDPATGQPFVNQGTCVTFVNNGGTLKTPPVAVVPEIGYHEAVGGLAGYYTYGWDLTGFPAVSPASVDITDADGTVHHWLVTTDSAGTYTTGESGYPGTCANPVTSITATAGPVSSTREIATSVC